MPDSKNKVFVLDTSVLLYSANSIRSFEDNELVIPYVVLEEVDKFKSREGEVGANARQIVRELNRLRKLGPINKGIPVNKKGGLLRVELNFNEPETHNLTLEKNDDRIINVCLGLQKSNYKVVLVTKDVNLAVRADVLGVEVQDFDTDRTVSSVEDMYTGSSTVYTTDEIIDRFFAGEKIYQDELGTSFNHNHYLTLVSEVDSRKTALARVRGENFPLSRLHGVRGAWGIKSRNREQQFAIDALLDSNISLVSLTGPPGTGKTLVSLACALQQVQDDNIYDRLVVSRPVQPLGKDIGFIPGDIDQKMSPWMGPIRDSLEFLTKNKDKNRDIYEEMIGMKMLEVEPLTYIRGRSMPRTIFILDEAQDITRPEIKTIVSRMGEGSKLILVGDIMQIGNPYLDSTNNGLSNVVEKFKPYKFSAHITMIRGERSELATVAGEIL